MGHHLACRRCGRQIYTVSSIEALALDERRCPGCSAGLWPERRLIDRRVVIRRQFIPDLDLQPVHEQRVAERRQVRRRQTLTATGTNRVYGWSARSG
jgi:DNA-directed RNA polymerase subunit RPC12/RpoP